MLYQIHGCRRFCRRRRQCRRHRCCCCCCCRRRRWHDCACRFRHSRRCRLLAGVFGCRPRLAPSAWRAGAAAARPALAAALPHLAELALLCEVPPPLVVALQLGGMRMSQGQDRQGGTTLQGVWSTLQRMQRAWSWAQRSRLRASTLRLQVRLSPSKSPSGWNLPHCWQNLWGQGRQSICVMSQVVSVLAAD